MFMIANQPPSANNPASSDHDADSVRTGSITSSDRHPHQRGNHYHHGNNNNSGMMGTGTGMNQELPLDSLSSRSFSTDSHDSRFVKLWSENMHLDTPGGGDIPGDTGYGGSGNGNGGGILNRDVMVFGHGSGGGIGARSEGFPSTLMGGKPTVVRKTIIGSLFFIYIHSHLIHPSITSTC